jgi:hypothetical protein
MARTRTFAPREEGNSATQSLERSWHAKGEFVSAPFVTKLGRIEQAELRECLREAWMLHGVSLKYPLVFGAEGRGRIEEMKGAIHRRGTKKLYNMVVVFREAVADNQDTRGLSDGRTGLLPDGIEQPWRLLTANWCDDQRVTADRGATVVILDELTVALSPGDRAMELQERYIPAGNDALDVRVAWISAARQVLGTSTVVEAWPGYPWTRPVTHPTLGQDVVVGGDDCDHGSPHKYRIPKLLVSQHTPAIKILLG